MAALAREELRGAEHPSTSRLLAYQRGEGTPAEVAAVREHLSLCEECSAVVLDAAEFFAEEDEEEEDSPAELEREWQELRRLVPDAHHPPAPAAVLPLPAAAPSRPPLWRSLGFAYGLAASFAAVSLGLGFFRAFPAPVPQANAGLYDLTSSGQDRSERAEATPMAIRFASPSVLLLNPEEVPDSERYGVRVRRGDGTVAWESESFVPQRSGAFHLGLPAGALKAGEYSLQLYGISEGRETPLGTYSIRIEE